MCSPISLAANAIHKAVNLTLGMMETTCTGPAITACKNALITCSAFTRDSSSATATVHPTRDFNKAVFARWPLRPSSQPLRTIGAVMRVGASSVPLDLCLYQKGQHPGQRAAYPPACPLDLSVISTPMCAGQWHGKPVLFHDKRISSTGFSAIQTDFCCR